MKRKLLLLVCTVLTTISAWSYTSVVPQVGRSYYLYNIGTGKYWQGTSSDYTVTENIADATPITVESGYKLAFNYNGTTYRIHHENGTKKPANTVGVNFTFEGSATDLVYGYQLKSKNSDYDRWMCPDGTFQRKGNYTNRDWFFYSVEEVSATIAEANYVNGWEKVTSVSSLQTNPDDYFFAIFSANAAELMLRTNTSDGKPYYITAASPLNNAEYLFEIGNYTYSESSFFVLKSCGTNAYYYPLYEHAYDLYAPSADKTVADDACRLTFEVTDGIWNIKTWAVWESGSYLGLWTPGNGYVSDQNLAGNKTDANKGSFLIYRIAKKNLDMTSRIVNPDMETEGDGEAYWQKGVKGWTNCSAVTNYRQLAFTEGQNPNGAFTGTYAFENWHSSSLVGTMSQTISNLPNGVYKLQLAALVRTVNGQFIYGKSNDITYKTNLAGSGEQANDYSVYVVVADNQLEIGLDMNDAGADWAAIDNARLTYIASSLPALLTKVSGKMKASVDDAQTAAVDAYNAAKTATNYGVAIEAIAAAEISKAAYAKANTYLTSVEAVLSTTNFYTTAAYNSIYGDYKTAYDAGTMDDATADGLSYKVANYTGTERYDNNTANNLLIPGWTFGGNDATESGSGFYINTWSTEDNSNGFANPFFEYWTDDASVLGAKKIVGTLSGLTPNKYYIVTAQVRVKETNSATMEDGKITMQVGEGTPVDVTTGEQISTTQRYVGQFSAIGRTDEDGKLVLTFDVASGSNISWLSFRNLNYEEAPEVNMNVAAGKWGTFIAPFDVTIPENISAYKATGVNNNRVTLDAVTTTIPANTPVLLKNDTEDAVAETFYGISTATQDSYTEGLLTGVYTAAKIPAGEHHYILQTQPETGQAFYLVETAFTATPYKCYLTYVAPTPVKAFYLDFDSATGITKTTEKTEGTVSLFDLSGRRVSKAQKGLYIMNGKKVLVK